MKKEKILGAAAAVLFFLLFFVWGMRGRFWTVFTAFFPRFHIIFALTCLLFCLALFLFQDRCEKLIFFLIKCRYKYLPLLGFLFPALIAIFVFDSIPHVIDAAHFLWSARLFIETGTFHLPTSELYEYYQNTFNLDFGGRYFSLFLPGFSFFLVPFELLGIPHLFTPLCNGLSILVLGKIADERFDEKVSFFAMFFALFSSFYLFIAASFMTHSFNLLLTLIAIYIVLCKKSGKFYLLAGFTASILLFIRPQNAFFVYIGILILLLAEKRGFKSFLFFTAPFIAVGFLLMFYNFFYTGNPMIFPQDVYFSIREPYPFCHRMGFGKGCPNTEGDYLPKEGLTPTYAFLVAFMRLTLMNFNMTGHPLIFLFLVISFLFSFKKNMEMSLFFLIFFASYFFFYLSGNLFGPRYFTEVASLLLIPCGYGFFKLLERFKKYGKAIIAAIPAAIFLLLLTTIMPALISRFSDSFWTTDRSVERAIERAGISDSILFVPPFYSSVFLNLMERPPYDRRGNLILLDLGEENSYATAYFMEKGNFNGAYVIDYYEGIAVKTAITPIYEAARDAIIFEFEDKRLPLTGKPDYGVNFAMSEEEEKQFYPVKSITEDVSKGSVFAMRFDELNDLSYYDFSHPILNSGEYDFELYYLADRCGTQIEVSIDGETAGVFDSFSPEQRRRVFQKRIYLESGNHKFKLTPKFGDSCLMIDSVEMYQL